MISIPIYRMITFYITKNTFITKYEKGLSKVSSLIIYISNIWFVIISKLLSTFSQKLHIPIIFIVKPLLFEHFCKTENINNCSNTIHELLFNILLDTHLLKK